jgi:hypothetical protein
MHAPSSRGAPNRRSARLSWPWPSGLVTGGEGRADRARDSGFAGSCALAMVWLGRSGGHHRGRRDQVCRPVGLALVGLQQNPCGRPGARRHGDRNCPRVQAAVSAATAIGTPGMPDGCHDLRYHATQIQHNIAVGAVANTLATRTKWHSVVHGGTDASMVYVIRVSRIPQVERVKGIQGRYSRRNRRRFL